MHPILLAVGSLHIYSYGFMVSVGFLLGIIVAYILARKTFQKPDIIFDLSIFAMIGGIVGARLFYVIFYFNELKSPIEAFMIWNGGLVFYGGVALGTISLLLASKIYKMSPLEILDVATPATFLGYAFGRIGCFLNGCCYGELASLPWAVKFPMLEGLRHPTQIYSSIIGFILFLVLVKLFYHRKFPGQIFSFGVFMYGGYRFFIEFLRTNPKVFLNITLAQWGSLFLVVLGVVLYFVYAIRNRN